MKYLLDTDIVGDALVGKKSAEDLLSRLYPHGLAISIITYSELFDAALGSYDIKQTMKVLTNFVKSVRLFGITKDIAQINAQSRIDLRARKKQYKHRALDLYIAATAISYKLQLVTGNKKHFEDIAGIKLL